MPYGNRDVSLYMPIISTVLSLSSYEDNFCNLKSIQIDISTVTNYTVVAEITLEDGEGHYLHTSEMQSCS